MHVGPCISDASPCAPIHELHEKMRSRLASRERGEVGGGRAYMNGWAAACKSATRVCGSLAPSDQG